MWRLVHQWSVGYEFWAATVINDGHFLWLCISFRGHELWKCDIAYGPVLSWQKAVTFNWYFQPPNKLQIGHGQLPIQVVGDIPNCTQGDVNPCHPCAIFLPIKIRKVKNNTKQSNENSIHNANITRVAWTKESKAKPIAMVTISVLWWKLSEYNQVKNPQTKSI